MKIISYLKKVIYWLSIIAPLIDGVKNITELVMKGIEDERQSITEARARAKQDLFNDLERANFECSANVKKNRLENDR